MNSHRLTKADRQVGCRRERMQQVAPLFDHFVGEREQPGREGETQCPGNFRIEDKLEFRRPLDRQIGGLGALEDAIDIIGQASVGLGNARPVGV